MPSLYALAWAIVPVFLAYTYQAGLSTFLTSLVTETSAYKIAVNALSTTYCYVSVKTLSEDLELAECFSVSNGKFSRVFLDDTSFPIVKEARVGYVVPGFMDGHGHLVQYGELLDSVNLFGAEDMEEVKQRLKEYKTKRPETGTSEQWLRGVGWDQANFEDKWPVSSDLEIDNTFKDLYVMLDRIDVHCIWVSEKVLSLLPSSLPDIVGGEIPAPGVFCDNAMDIVLEHYPKPGTERKTKFVKEAMVELNKLGIVGMSDAGVTPSELELYKKLSQDNDWTVRVNAMIECETRNTFCPEDVEKIVTPNGMLQILSVKLFGDGALGSWGSAMIEPYTDKPESSGSLLVNATTLSQLTLDWAKAGYQVNIHSIGDQANRNAVDAFEAALKHLCPDTDLHLCQNEHRFRIEHAQTIHPDDQSRILKLGIIPSIQPTHATSDMYYVEDRLGRERTQSEAYRMRSLLATKPILGSDFPVEPANILEGIYAATTRLNPKTGLDQRGDEFGFNPAEKLNVEQALRGFTVNPAYGAFLDGKAGVIKTGAFADWVVLSEPINSVDPRKNKILETWVGGKMVYQHPDRVRKAGY